MPYDATPIGKPFQPLEKFPLTVYDLFDTLTEAEAYAASLIGTPGWPLRVKNATNPNIYDSYTVNGDGTLSMVGGKTTSSNVTLGQPIQFNGTSWGGWNNGDTAPATMTVYDFLKRGAQKQVPPTYLAPFITLTGTDTTAAEVGTVKTVTLTPSWNQRDAGAISNYTLLRGAAQEYSGPAAIPTNNVSVTCGDTATIFQATASYAEGAVKNDNFNQPYPTGHIPAGSVSSNVVSYVGQRYLFYGGDSGVGPMTTSTQIRGLTGKILNPVAGMFFTMSIPVGVDRIQFAYPATLPDPTQIIYAGVGSYLSKFTKTSVSVNGANSYTAVVYKLWTYDFDVATLGNIVFEVTL